MLTARWRWRQHGSPKRCYPTSSLHSVTTQKTTTWNFAETFHCVMIMAKIPQGP